MDSRMLRNGAKNIRVRRVLVGLSVAVLSLTLMSARSDTHTRGTEVSEHVTAGPEPVDPLSGHVAFARAVSEFERAFGANYFGSGVSVEPSGDSRYWITLKSRPDPAQLNAMQSFPLAVDVRTTAAGTARELEISTQRIWSTLTEEFGSGIMVGPNDEGSRIVVSFDPGIFPESRITSALESLRGEFPGIPLVLERAAEFVTTDFAALRGGASGHVSVPVR